MKNYISQDYIGNEVKIGDFVIFNDSDTAKVFKVAKVIGMSELQGYWDSRKYSRYVYLDCMESIHWAAPEKGLRPKKVEKFIKTTEEMYNKYKETETYKKDFGEPPYHVYTEDSPFVKRDPDLLGKPMYSIKYYSYTT